MRAVRSVIKGEILRRHVTFQKIQEIHAMGTAILLVEQNVSRALTLVQRAYVLESGKVIMHGTSAELAGNKQVQAAYLGI